jgi:dTDP-4-dehydrorhamnose reductase
MKVVIIGAGGRLGAALMREYRRKFEVTGLNHAQLDLSNRDQIRERVGGASFDVLINTAAFTNVDLCETQRDQAFHINAEAPRQLAEICLDKDAKFIHFSTDYVFDGKKRKPYTEEDEANPISAYGESKRAGEENVLSVKGRHLVVRVSWVFGPDRPSFVDGLIKRAQENEHVDAIADKFSSPTYTHDVAEMLPRFFNVGPVAGVDDPGSAAAVIGRGYSASDYSGILHFANTGECSWQEYGQWALDCCQEAGLPLKAKRVGERKLTDMTNWVARRPVNSVLSSAKYTKLTGRSPRAWRDAVADYIRRFYSKQ